MLKIELFKIPLFKVKNKASVHTAHFQLERVIKIPIWQILGDFDQIQYGMASLLVIINCKLRLTNFANLDPQIHPWKFSLRMN